MFSGALLQVLKQGNKEGPLSFSLRGLKREVEQEIRREHGEDLVMPVIRSPVQPDRDIAELPLFPNAGRRPPRGREIFRKKEDIAQCFVIESATEEKVKKNELLGVTVGSALEKYKGTLTAVIGKPLDTNPVVVNVDRIVASRDGFKNALQALCQAEIAAFDVTNYEPAVMLLLGIRSVVRRGVTIASYGGEYVIGNPVMYPFSIKEVNIVSHSDEQIRIEDPIDLIGEKIIAGFEQLRFMTTYLDLPVYDAIRSLPPEREQRIPKEYSEQVLMLCPFSQGYSDNNWKRHLKRYLPIYLPKSDDGTSPRILRTLDMKSPRLVSQSLYEAIRLTLMCIVDWTEWRPNVFFELGVRLAAVNTNPVCIIEETHKTLIEELANIEDWNERTAKARTWREANNAANDEESNTKEAIERLVYSTYQCKRLLEMFDLIYYRAPTQGGITEKDRERYRDIVSYHEQLIRGDDRLGHGKTVPPGFTYKIVGANIDVSMEVSAVQVHDELIRTADLLSDPQRSSTGRSPVLYPGNALLSEKASEGALERRLAAWYYIDNRLEHELDNNPDLHEKYVDLGNVLVRALLRSPREGDKEKANLIRKAVREQRGLQKKE
jgi:hypothetical protein